MALPRLLRQSSFTLILLVFVLLAILIRWNPFETRLVSPSDNKAMGALSPADDQGREYILKDITKLPAVNELLSGSHTTWDDPTLVKVIREELLHPPRPYLTKMSYPLFQTPQAKAVDGILQMKVGVFQIEGHS